MTRPGFTGPPVWELVKHDWKGGRLLAGERVLNGSVFFDLRRWVKEDAMATKEGVTLPCDEVRSLADALLAYADRRDATALPSGN